MSFFINSANSESIKHLILISKGANINAMDDEGNTPLDIAKTEEMRGLLTSHGALSFAL